MQIITTFLPKTGTVFSTLQEVISFPWTNIFHITPGRDTHCLAENKI
jgi:hypothetical protein